MQTYIHERVDGKLIEYRRHPYDPEPKACPSCGNSPNLPFRKKGEREGEHRING